MQASEIGISLYNSDLKIQMNQGTAGTTRNGVSRMQGPLTSQPQAAAPIRHQIPRYESFGKQTRVYFTFFCLIVG